MPKDWILVTQIHGLLSIVLIATGCGIGVLAISRESLFLAAGYCLVAVLALGAILLAFCSKCTCKEHCGHVILGKLARHIHRPAGPYSAMELAIVAASFLLIIGLPQFFLWKQSLLLIGFWALVAFALLEIRLVICTRCENRNCPVRIR
jgi:hypothetical protein